MANKKKVSFMLDEDIIYKVKERALKERTTQTELFNKWIIQGLKDD